MAEANSGYAHREAPSPVRRWMGAYADVGRNLVETTKTRASPSIPSFSSRLLGPDLGY